MIFGARARMNWCWVSHPLLYQIWPFRRENEGTSLFGPFVRPLLLPTQRWRRASKVSMGEKHRRPLDFGPSDCSCQLVWTPRDTIKVNRHGNASQRERERMGIDCCTQLGKQTPGNIIRWKTYTHTQTHNVRNKENILCPILWANNPQTKYDPIFFFFLFFTNFLMGRWAEGGWKLWHPPE